jgi:hypothetical protein
MEINKAYEAVQAFLTDLREKLEECEKEMATEQYPYKPMTDGDMKRNVGNVEMIDGTIQVSGSLMLSYEGYDFGVGAKPPMYINEGLLKIAKEYGFSWEWVNTYTISAIW